MRKTCLGLVLALSLSAWPAANAQDLTKDLQWRSVGPSIMGGRVDDFAVVESNPDIIYMAAASGGLWKSMNGGTTWMPVFDDFGTTSIGDVAVAPSNPNIVWVGTGEANARQSVSWGNGVYKSVDGGATWQRMGLEDSRHVGRIVIDPKNPDVVYVAALGHLWGPNKERGLFKTTDGGRTWVNTKLVDENTGFADVIMDPSDSKVLYAASYQRRRTPFGFNGGGPGSALWKTTDAGKTWTKLAGGLPSGITGRIGLDIYRKNPAVIYATVEHKEGGIFRSDDRGKTWKKVNGLNPRPLYFSQIRIDPQDDSRIYVLGVSLYVSDNGGKTFRSDGARNLHVDHHAMWIDPRNPNHLIVGNDGGVGISYDRARTWLRVNNIPLGQTYVVGYDTRDPFYLYAGLQDNGVWSGPNATRYRVGPLNDDWIQIVGGDGQFVTADPNDARAAYVAMQDGRLLRFDYVTGETKAIRPVEPERGGGPGGAAGAAGGGRGSGGRGGAQAGAAAGAQAGGAQAAGAGGGQSARGGLSPVRFNWTAPVVLSPHDPRIVYLAGNRIWRSLDGGERWTAISGDLTRLIDREKLPIMGVTGDMLGKNDGVSAYGTITAFGESPVQAGMLLAGTDDGNVQLSKDAGAGWTNLAAKIPGLPDQSWVSAVALSRFDARRMFVAFDNHRTDDYAPYVYRSDDGGATWQPMIGGLPRIPVRAVKEDPRNPDLLFAGTEGGLYYSLDRGATWKQLKNRLPDVPVADIEIQPRTRELILGTHGRSIYLMNIAPLEEMTKEIAAAPAHLFTPVPATTFNHLEHRDFLAQGVYVGANPPRGAALDYYLARPAPEARIVVQDRDGRVVRELKGSGEAGLHRVVWDLRFTPPPQMPRAERSTEGVEPGDPRPAESTLARVPGDFGGGGDPTGGEAGAPPEPPRGPMVLPGEYLVKLIVPTATTSLAASPAIEKTAIVRVNGDPRVSISDDDLRARQKALMDAYDAQLAGVPVLVAAGNLNTQMTAISKAIGQVKDAKPEVKTAVDEASRTVRDAQGGLSRAMSSISSVARDISTSTSLPTEAQQQRLSAALQQLKGALPPARDLPATLVPAFNKKLDELAVPATVPRLTLQTTTQAPPDTEIFLAPLSKQGAKLQIGVPANMSNNPGYDNQPSFTPDGKAVLFTSVRGGGTQTDIYRFDIPSRQIARVTSTPESEYSPTVTPDGRHISVVRVEADSTQRLWRFTLDGGAPELVLTDIKPVGYHAWADARTLALYVLGSPATLQLADTQTGKAEVIAKGIGRSLQRIPGGNTVSFVVREPAAQPGGAPTLTIRELDPKTRQTSVLVRAVAGTTEADCAWTPDGMLLMAHGGTLYGWRREDAEWTRVADLDALGLHGVTRLAVGPKGDRIAFVTQGSQ